MQNYNAIFCTVPTFLRISICARRRIILAQALLCIVLVSALGECSHIYASPIPSLAPSSISHHSVGIIGPDVNVYFCPSLSCKVIDTISTQNTTAFCQTTGAIVFDEENVFHHFRPAIRTDINPFDTAIPTNGFGIGAENGAPIFPDGAENGAPVFPDGAGGGNTNNWWTKLMGSHGNIGWVNNIYLQGGIIIPDIPYC